LDPIPCEDLNRTVIHFHWEVDRQFPLAIAEDFPHVVIKSENVRGDIELFYGNIKQVMIEIGAVCYRHC
jgi:hypothetical protein